MTSVQKTWDSLGRRIWPASAARAKSVREFSEMLWDQGMYGIEQEPADQADSQLPLSLNDTLQKLLENNPGTSDNTLWKFRFIGQYKDVKALLAKLEARS